jgi:hypothetical protein
MHDMIIILNDVSCVKMFWEIKIINDKDIFHNLNRLNRTADNRYRWVVDSLIEYNRSRHDSLSKLFIHEQQKRKMIEYIRIIINMLANKKRRKREWEKKLYFFKV